jgi:two-component system, cell cycle sensor histidine kinase PleC
MLRKIIADLKAAADFVAGISRLPAAIRMSLDPETKAEALLVASQLDLARVSLRLFDYTLPFAGALIFIFDQFHKKSVLGAWLAALTATCIANEIFLNRNPEPSQDPIESVRIRSRRQTFICMLLATLWSSVAIWLWSPAYPANQIFIELILCCTLASLVTMASLHAASVVGPTILVSVAVIAVPMIKDMQMHPVLIGITVIFVGLMVTHACMIQMRTLRMLRLEDERTELIQHLQNAKTESDLAHEAAVAASRAKSEFLANMSHELRTPLNAIIGFSDIVRSQTLGEAAGKYSEYGGFINQAGQHLLSMISDILDLAKIEAGKKVLNHVPVDLSNAILDASRRIEQTAAAKGLELNTIARGELPLFRADPHALRQILDHLVSNAVRFTPKGGRVELAAFLSEGGVAFCVTDSGIGIPLEDQAHIFTRLGHRRPEVTTAERGSGLGLPIVKALCDMHRARIELSSVPGEGTCVAVFFPPESTIAGDATRAA